MVACYNLQFWVVVGETKKVAEVHQNQEMTKNFCDLHAFMAAKKLSISSSDKQGGIVFFAAPNPVTTFPGLQ